MPGDGGADLAGPADDHAHVLDFPRHSGSMPAARRTSPAQRSTSEEIQPESAPRRGVPSASKPMAAGRSFTSGRARCRRQRGPDRRHHRRRQARRAEDGHPAGGVEAGHAGLLQARHLRQQGRPLTSGDSKSPQPPVPDVAKAGGVVDHHRVHTAGDDVRQRRRRGAIGHMRRLDAGQAAQCRCMPITPMALAEA